MKAVLKMKRSQSFWFYDLDSIDDILANLNWDLPGLRPGKDARSCKQPTQTAAYRRKREMSNRQL
jgi:hypothetical protein